MVDLHLELVGQPVVRRDGCSPAPIPLSLQPFLAFLGLSNATGCHRDRLIDCLWPDATADQGRHRLNTAVWRCRRLFGVEHNAVIVATRAGHIALNRTIVTIDIAPVVRALSDERRAAAKRGEPVAIEDLRRAVRVDVSQFLVGNYNDWVVQARHQLEHAVIKGVETLVEVAPAGGSTEWAELLVRLDPLREDAHRRLIRLYADAGRRADALRQYETCVRHLREDLGVEPLIETTLVAAAVREGITPLATDVGDPRRALGALRDALASCQLAVERIESAIAALPPD